MSVASRGDRARSSAKILVDFYTQTFLLHFPIFLIIDVLNHVYFVKFDNIELIELHERTLRSKIVYFYLLHVP